MPPQQENAYNFVDCSPKETTSDAYKSWEFRKNCANESPQVQIYGQNSKFWQFWDLYSHTSAPQKWNLAQGREVMCRPCPVELVGAKCVPILLYGICQLSNADLRSLDFTFNRLFMKLFKTKSIDVVKACQSFTGSEVQLFIKEENR